MDSLYTEASIPQKLTKSFIVFAVFLVIAYGVRAWISRSSRLKNKKSKSTKPDEERINLMYDQLPTIIFYFIIVMVMLFILPIYGINTITILGTIGLAIGLASQNALNNIFSGIFILINDTYRLEDIIQVQMVPYYNSPGNVITGKVKSFNLFYTRLEDLTSGNEISIPNGVLYGNTSVIENQTITYKDI